MTSRVRASILALTFTFIVALPTLASAQEPAQFGVKVGANFAKLRFDDDDNEGVKGKTDVVAGLFASKAVSGNVGIRGEVNFSRQGAKFEDNGDEASINLTYVNIPVLLTLTPSSGGSTSVNVFTGPQIGFNAKAETEADGVTVDFKDEVKSTDFSWVVGVGLASGRFSGDVRYALGLTNIAKEGDTVKNGVFSVNVGIRLK